MLTGSALASAILGLPNSTFTGNLFRSVILNEVLGNLGNNSLRRRRLLAGIGSPKGGARFTRIGGPNSLYLADEPETALLELRQNFWNEQTAPPAYLTYTVRAQLQSLLDISDSSVQTTLEITPEELKEPWRLRQDRGERVPTQVLGQAVFDSGRYQAIRYSSARVPGKTCVLIFPDLIRDPYFIEIYDFGNILQDRIPPTNNPNLS
jgi:RES domain-containing protein